jgi:hypothetical protein
MQPHRCAHREVLKGLLIGQASMAAFSLVQRDSDPTEKADRDPPSLSVLRYHRDIPRPAVAPREAVGPGELEYGMPGRIVLRLPDLEASLGTSRFAAVRPYLFWLAIGLGALLAVSLIWTGDSPEPRPVEEAPSWGIQDSQNGYAPQELSGASFDDSRSEIRAARRVESPWDNSAPPALPGVAVPVGTIINGAQE